MIGKRSSFEVRRLGVVMSPDPHRSDEVEGVLNPATARGPDGELYLFPRIVGRGNYSRIGLCRVLFDDKGDEPVGVERLGYALEPSAPYELRPDEGGGGCEDPRVTFIDSLGEYAMVYAAWGDNGPRLAVAVSKNCLSWKRLGLVTYAHDSGVDFNNYDNKDGAYGPAMFARPDGSQCFGLLHRPMYTNKDQAPAGIEKPVPSIWVSYCEAAKVQHNISAIIHVHGHMLGIDPEHPWEHLRIGAGTPPIRTHLGMMVIYHGVAGTLARSPTERNVVNYVAGVVFFEPGRDGGIRYRSDVPIMIPETAEETSGVVNNVVFPTGIDDRGNGIVDIYYGMGDRHIGAARLRLPDELPPFET
jgi:beta-1,2-mannobiose phosphorylase / 1,2-beta-oligomannan phosphorylase